MSTLKVTAITDTSGGNTTTINSMTPTADSLQGFRNRIINGDMRIDQRNAGAAIATGQAYAVDRWQADSTQASKINIQQNNGSVTPPAGFIKYWGANVTSAYSVTSTDTFYLRQQIEGTNVADLNWGTANAKTVTLSFWVRSSLTGTFGGSIKNSTSTRSYPFSYSISSANTWEQKSITIAGDTSGTWLTDTNVGIRILFSQGAGSNFLGTAGAWAGANYDGPTGQTNLVGTLNATWYITGVQLEVGSTATPFERRPYGTELALCQRYFYSFDTTTLYAHPGSALSANSSSTRFYFPTTMRATPTGTYTGTLGDGNTTAWTLYNNGNYRTVSALSISNLNKNSMRMEVTTSSGVAASDAVLIYCFDNNGGASLTASAEL